MKSGPGQITIRKVPRRLNAALRKKAIRDGVSMNSAAIEAMANGLGLGDELVRHRDLDFLAGTWGEDAKFDQALAEQRRVDPEMWK
jgi:plasmid stability protein